MAWGLRTTAARIRRAGHPVSIGRSKELVGITVPMSRCLACGKRRRAGNEFQPISRSWYEAWRVLCGFCRRPFHIGSGYADRTKEAPLVSEGLWDDAVRGSKLFDRYLVGRPCGGLPPRLIWALASTPILSRSHARVAFGLIVPEASHPKYGMEGYINLHPKRVEQGIHSSAWHSWRLSIDSTVSRTNGCSYFPARQPDRGGRRSPDYWPSCPGYRS